MKQTLIRSLVIDGDSAAVKLPGSHVNKSGYTVLSAALGREGLISAWRDQPSIIIPDPTYPI